MTDHPEEALPAHGDNITDSGSTSAGQNLTVGELRETLQPLSAQTLIKVRLPTSDTGHRDISAVASHHQPDEHILVIDTDS